MNNIVKIKNLNYLDFHEFNLDIEENSYTTIVGPNKSGKTTLLKIISGIIKTSDVCECNGVILNRDNVFNYVKNIGVVSGVNKNSFIYEIVKEELMYPLINLGYPKMIIERKIKKILGDLRLESLYNKKISSLNNSMKQLLLFVIALLHGPKVLLIDDAFLLLNDVHKKLIFNYLIGLKKKNGLTVVYFTSDMNGVINSDCLYLLENFKIKVSGKPLELLCDDQMFYQSNLEVPFMIDLSTKLKMYGLIDNLYLDMEELVDKIWK